MVRPLPKKCWVSTPSLTTVLLQNCAPWLRPTRTNGNAKVFGLRRSGSRCPVFSGRQVHGGSCAGGDCGCRAGLGLVVAQRFVKVDLLGGFAVFGTIMLLISAGFSLAFQDDYWVQMKSTILGLFTASCLWLMACCGKARILGRALSATPLPLHHDRIAVGMSALGIVMAGANYLVAENFSEDFWLTWTTFLDMPVSIAMFYAIVYWARKNRLIGGLIDSGLVAASNDELLSIADFFYRHPRAKSAIVG